MRTAELRLLTARGFGREGRGRGGPNRPTDPRSSVQGSGIDISMECPLSGCHIQTHQRLRGSACQPEPSSHHNRALTDHVVIADSEDVSRADRTVQGPLSPSGVSPAERGRQPHVRESLEHQKVVLEVPAHVLVPGVATRETDLAPLVKVRAGEDGVGFHCLAPGVGRGHRERRGHEQ